jgi:mono/diheme cytochrome c family protein
MTHSRLLLGVMLASALAACDAGIQGRAVEATPAKPLPILMFQPGTLDLGQVIEGKTAKGDLILRNTGDVPLTITNIQTSCGCTTGMLDERLLPPGGFTLMHVKVDTFAKRGRVKKQLWVSDNAGHTAMANLLLTVRSNPHMALSGRSIFDALCASCHAAPAYGKSQGPEIFAAVCAMCHGADAEGGYAPSLRGRHDAGVLAELISNGAGNHYMPGFAKARGGPLDPEQVQVLSKWLATLQ